MPQRGHEALQGRFVVAAGLCGQALDQALGRFGLHKAGRHGEHAHAFRRHFLGQAFAVSYQCRFGGGVGQRGVGQRHAALNGADVDDDARAPGEHTWQQAAVEAHGEQVHV